MIKHGQFRRLSTAIERNGLKDTAVHACWAGAQRAASLPLHLRRYFDIKTKLPARIDKVKAEIMERPDQLFHEIRKNTLAYVESNHKPEMGDGAYSYKLGGPPILYASCYAALTRHLYNDLAWISEPSRLRWVSYLRSFQTDDGLFRDPIIDNVLAEKIDWWGWRHLTLHVLMALTALGGTAVKPFQLTKPFKKKGFMAAWIESRKWQVDPASVSNEIQNFGVMLQYARDFQGEAWCEGALQEMFDWLDSTQDPQTGLWGERFDSKSLLSNGVQTGYHLWLLYFYDSRPIHYIDRIIDSCLATRNIYGGFGVALNSSACEDIDSLDPLVRFSFATDYRNKDIRQALKKSFPWVLVNANPDGGWVFRRYEAFQYGHEKMRVDAEESSMFPTWFRSLTLAYLGKVLVEAAIASYPYSYLNCPGHQFWKQ